MVPLILVMLSWLGDALKRIIVNVVSAILIFVFLYYVFRWLLGGLI